MQAGSAGLDADSVETSGATKHLILSACVIVGLIQPTVVGNAVESGETKWHTAALARCKCQQ